MPDQAKPPTPQTEEATRIEQRGKLLPPKPRASLVRPWLTRLPALTPLRRTFRFLLRWIARLLITVLAQVEVSGLEQFPMNGAYILVSNHLGDADSILGLAFFPRFVDPLAKSELYDLPFLGWLMEAYGVIWIHRGQPDLKAIHAALDGLKQRRMIAIAPEARESLTGGLEAGTGGAAFLALQADVPIVPVTLTGTENKNVISTLKRFRRTHLSLTIGQPFHLAGQKDSHEAVRQGTEQIMETLASQLPERYRGVYQANGETKRYS